MTTTERQQTRAALLSAGFQHVNSTTDNGEGRYIEWWRSTKDGSLITLTWDKKTRDIPVEIIRIVDDFTAIACSAVEFVGVANYAEREREAKRCVQAASLTASRKLRALFNCK